MKVFKLDNDDFTQACRELAAANDDSAEAAKRKKAATEMIWRILGEERGVKRDDLKIGDKIYIDKLLLIEGKKQNRFDQARFKLDHAEEYQEYSGEALVVSLTPEVD